MDLLSKPENKDGLTTKDIILKIDPETTVYDNEGKLDRKSTQYKSWSRTLLSMVAMKLLTKSSLKTHETVWKKAP